MAYNNPYNNNPNPAYGGGGGYAQSNPYDTRGSDSFDTRNDNPAPSYGKPYGQTSEVEMQPLTHNAAGPYGQAPSASGDPNAILNECRAVGRSIDELDARLTELQRLQRAFISGTGTSAKELDGVSADLMTQYRALADRVKRVKGQRAAQDPRNRAQVDALDRRIRKAINTFQQAESAFRRDVQEQQRRQYLIVRPEASEQEIREATESGADTQIFQQALMHSDRRGAAQSTLRNVQQRHDAIKQIERTMMELAQLFQDLDQIIIEQEPMIQQIEQKAEETHTHLEAGNVHVAKAVVSARAARKKKWICLGIVVAIILVVIAIVLIYLGVTGQLGSKNNSSSNNNKTN